MAGRHLNRVLNHVRRLVAAPNAGPPDQDLLGRFLTQGDDRAFAALVEQHGPMVLGVCRRALRHEQDAEDACQATFLVLARKAGSVRKRAALASWLHGVAYRVARKLSAARARRPAPLEAAGEVALRGGPPDLTWREALAILDEELNRLPDKYRAPLVLCYLEGKTQDEAARQLGWGPGTLRGRLDRGRARLRARLTRRGVALPSALAGVGLAQGSASAVPPPLAAATARAGSLAAAGGSLAGVVPGRVAYLARGVTRSMLLAKAQTAAAVLALGALAAGAVLAGRGTLAPPQAERAAGEPAPALAAQPDGPPRADRLGDPLPPGALARLGTTRFRHPGYVYEVSFTPDSKTVVTAGDGGARLWDLATGKELRRFDVAAIAATAAALSPDGKVLANAGLQKAVCLWDAATGKELRQFGEERDAPAKLAWSPDAGTLVSVPLRDPKALCLWDVAAGRVRHTVRFNAGDVHSLAVSPASRAVAVACWRDPVVHLIDPLTGREVRQDRGHRAEVCAVAWSPDGKSLVSGGNDFTARLWDAATGKDRWRRETAGGVSLLAFAPDGKAVAIQVAGEGTPQLWDAATGKKARTMEGPYQHAESLAFSPDGRVLAASPGSEHTPVFWDVTTGKRLHAAVGHAGAVGALSFTPDGRRLLSAGTDGGLFWGLGALGAAPPSAERVEGTRPALSADGKYLAAAGAYLERGGREPRTQVVVREAGSGKVVHRLRGLEHVGVPALLFSADGTRLVATNSRGPGPLTVHVWDVAAGKEVVRFRWLPTDQHTAPAVSPDGRLLALAAGKDGGVALVDASTGKEARRLTGHKGTVAALAFSPDGAAVVAAGPWDDDAHLWDVATGRELRRLEAKVGSSAVAFCGDGRAVATGGADNAVRVWEVVTGRERCRFAGHRARVRALAFSPDGAVLVSGGEDTTVLAWDLAGRSGRGAAAAGLAAGEAERLWADLGSEDAAGAYRALCRLLAAPRQSVPFLRARLRPAPEPDAQRVDGLVRDLDSPEFDVRQRATRALGQLGDAAGPSLRRVLAGGPSAEARRRIEGLLAEWSPDRPGALRLARAVEALERAGTAEARELLEALAGGAEGARLTREAKAALHRLPPATKR